MLPQARALTPDKPYRDFVVDRWDVEQGLPQITVSAIAQDANGYLWFGTQTGLARFDGVRFRRFGQQDIQVLDGNIQALLADGGRLWVGTAYGLLLMEQGRFHPITLAGAGGGRFPVPALARQDGSIFVAGPDGLYVPQQGRLQRKLPLPGAAYSLLVQDGVLWAGGDGCVYRIVQGKVQTLPLPAQAGSSPVKALVWHDGSLWAGGNRGLYHLDDRRWRAATAIPASTISALASDRDGTLWVATPQALLRVRQSHLVERIQDAPGSVAILSMLEDRNGNLWLGSQTEGVARVWNGYTRRLDAHDGLTTPLLWTLAAGPDGRIWAGTADGLEVWQQGRFQRVLRGAQLPHPEVYSLLPETDQVWLGTRAGAALLRRGRLDTPPALAALANTQVNAIFRDHRGALWFGTQDGLYRFEPDRPLRRFGKQEGLLEPRVRVLAETRDGRLLIGTSDGLFEWRDGRILPLGNQPGLDGHVSVSALHQLSNDLWVLGSTSGANLRVFDGKRWHAFSQRNNLPTNIPFHFSETADSLWVAGMQGVYRLPLAQLQRALKDPNARLDPQLVINSGFDRSGGQQDKCCNGTGNNRGLLQDGRLWLPTRAGILQLDTAGVITPPARHPVLIEGVRSRDQWLPLHRGLTQLPLDARDLKFEFTSPAFQPANMPRLRYRLLGYDQTWRTLDDPTLRSASYVNLPPGRYTFEAADFSRPQPLAEAARLELDLPPHLSETLAFKLLLGLFCASLLWLGYLGLRYRYVRQRRKLEQLVQARTRDLQAANERLQEISFTDALTGLHNRRYLTQQLPADFAFYARDPAYASGRDALIIALLDVDHFKTINDQWGHAAGDRVLEQLGKLLGELKRSGDYVARWGGEEFLLVMRPLPRGSLAQIGQRLCSSIAEHPFDLGNGQQYRLTISVGLVECPLFPQHPDLLNWDQLVSLADRAMYKVKTSGRNSWMACRPVAGARLPEDVSGLAGSPRRLLDSGLLEFVNQASP